MTAWKHLAAFLTAFVVVANPSESARAASSFSLTFDPASTMPGGTFAAVLSGSIPDDSLLSLDAVAEFDVIKLTFLRYETIGTSSAGFAGPTLSLPSVSLITLGSGATPLGGPLVRAIFSVSNSANDSLTTIRLFGGVGLDTAGDVPFDLSAQFHISAIPEVGMLPMLLAGLGIVFASTTRRRIRGKPIPEMQQGNSKL